MGKIDLKQVMEILQSGHWVTGVKLFTANMALNKGGKVLVLKHCRIARKETLERRNVDTEGSFTKSANHNKNFTLNVELKNKRIITIHPALIFEIDKQRVL